jgi:F-type H+-transporting ATPase subunit b
LSHFRFDLRMSFRVLVFAALVALAALVLAPCRAAAAQSAASGTTSAPANTPAAQSPAQPAQPAQSEDEGDAQFLHAPVVRSVARILHLPLDVTVEILLGINFAIILFAIAIPLARTMPKVIRKRSETLGHELNDARQATADAGKRLSAVEAQLAGLGEEIKKLAAQVEQESLEDEKRIKAAIGEESARIVAAAGQELEVALTQAKRGLRNLAADLAIGQAEKQIALSPETDRAVIAEFVAGAAGDGKGGRN